MSRPTTPALTAFAGVVNASTPDIDSNNTAILNYAANPELSANYCSCSGTGAPYTLTPTVLPASMTALSNPTGMMLSFQVPSGGMNTGNVSINLGTYGGYNFGAASLVFVAQGVTGTPPAPSIRYRTVRAYEMLQGSEVVLSWNAGGSGTYWDSASRTTVAAVTGFWILVNQPSRDFFRTAAVPTDIFSAFGTGIAESGSTLRGYQDGFALSFHLTVTANNLLTANFQIATFQGYLATLGGATTNAVHGTGLMMSNSAGTYTGYSFRFYVYSQGLFTGRFPSAAAIGATDTAITGSIFVPLT